jgi:Sulfotransferase family
MADTYSGENLIFIIAQHRSGSTLLQRIVGSHSMVQTSGEAHVMLHAMYGIKPEGVVAEYKARNTQRAVKQFCRNYGAGDETFYRAMRAMGRVFYEGALQETGKTFFLDKTPRYTNIIPELRRTFPGAKFIYLLRNPLAVLQSMHANSPNMGGQMFFTHMRELVDAPRAILAAIESEGPSAITVRYEELVEEPERVIAGLCERLGLPYEPAMIDYGHHPKPLGDFFDGHGVPFHTRPVRSSLEKWRTLGDDPQGRALALGLLHDHGRAMVERLGYSFDELTDAMKAKERPGERAAYSWRALSTTSRFPNPLYDGAPVNMKDELGKRPPLTISCVVPAGDSASMHRRLRSALGQGYAGLELIVVGGGDKARAAIETYEPWIVWLDRDDDPVASASPFKAISRGLEQAHGELVTWLMPNEALNASALQVMNAVFREIPHLDWLAPQYLDWHTADDLPVTRTDSTTERSLWKKRLRFSFFKRALWHRSGGLFDETLVWAADRELVSRMSQFSEMRLLRSSLGGIFIDSWWSEQWYAREVSELEAASGESILDRLGSVNPVFYDFSTGAWVTTPRREQ